MNETPRQDPSEIYLEAATLAQSVDPTELAEAYRLFASIPNYLDASKRAAALKPYYDKIELQKKLGAADSELKVQKKAKLLRALLGVFAALVIATFGILWYREKLHAGYLEAIEIYNNGTNYSMAIGLLDAPFNSKEAVDLKNEMQKAIDICDIATEELQDDSISYERLLELHQELSSVSYYYEADRLLSFFQSRLFSCTISDTSGTTTIKYDYASYDEANVSVDSSLPLSKLSAVNDFTLLNPLPDDISVTDFTYQYPSNGYTDHTIISESRQFSSDNYVTQQDFTYQDGSSLRIYHRWYNRYDIQLCGYYYESFVQPAKDQTVFVYSYKLDENGRIASSWRQELTSTGELSPEKKEETVYTYDDQDRLIRKESASSSTVYTYDEAAGIVEAVLKEGSTEITITYQYGYLVDFDDFARLN